jgi:hypothetical protein
MNTKIKNMMTVSSLILDNFLQLNQLEVKIVLMIREYAIEIQKKILLRLKSS